MECEMTGWTRRLGKCIALALIAALGLGIEIAPTLAIGAFGAPVAVR
jgi:hypothetical protein